ncbi:MAG TPA: WYL domain-containing protein, partial [Bacteroidales bacterium]|nr:WYL domain-containing protein [Bacteroidales bacterium]
NENIFTIRNDKFFQLIILQFFGISGNYVETKPLHGSQKGKWISPDVFEVNLELLQNYELEKLIISYGEDVLVVGPENLRKKISERLSKAVSLYRTDE